MNRHDTLLQAVNLAAEQFLILGNWEESINESLRLLGEAAGVSRVYIIKNDTESGDGRSTGQLLYEWSASGTAPLSENPEFQNVPYKKTGHKYWQEATDPDRSGNSLFNVSPGKIKKVFFHQDVKSSVIIPIIINSSSWGLIGFDSDQEESQWSGLEINVLKTAANILAGALQRQELENILRDSRARYRAVVDDQTEMICRYKFDGTLTFANDAFCRCFGKKRRDLIGHHLGRIVSPQCQDRIEQHISLLDQQIPVLTMNHQVKLPNGETRWHQWTDRAIFDENGNLLEYQAVGRDINDLKLAEQALQKIRDNLEQRVEEHTAALKRTYNRLIQTERIASLGLLVAGIAHEINNPNNFISFNIPILRDYLQEIITIVDHYAEEHRDYELFGMPYSEFRKDLFKLLNNIVHGSNRISSTVSRLREFARPQGNEDLRLVNLKPVIEQSIELCQSQIRKRVKTLDVHVPRDLPLININPQIIEQVLINLLTNAAQAADKENSWIKVSVELGETEKNYVILEVKDNGCGISCKSSREIFDPFYTTKGTEMGTGLGLYISRNLIEGLGGHIEVKSKLGEWSTFRVILPKLKQGLKQNRTDSD